MHKYKEQSFCWWTQRRLMYSSIVAPKAALLFKIDWSTLISVFGAHTTIITITVTVIAAHKRFPPSPDLCHHPPHPSTIALLLRHRPSLTFYLLCSFYAPPTFMLLLLWAVLKELSLLYICCTVLTLCKAIFKMRYLCKAMLI